MTASVNKFTICVANANALS